ncbi:MAG TPA: hypothetical protein VK190_04015, partial [Pseudoneobacillus sp.]|nr:hypothetical protein [Pseudoneobacillus sp.]
LGMVLAIISDRLYKKTQSLWKSRTLFTAICAILAGILYSMYPLLNGSGSIIILLSLVNTLVVTINTLNPTAVTSLLPQRRGVMTGTYYGVMTSSGIVAPIIFGKLIQDSGSNLAGGFSTSIYGMAIAMVIAAILIYLFGKPKHRVSTENDKRIVNL